LLDIRFFIPNITLARSKKRKCDSGHYRAKNSGFKTCVIVFELDDTGVELNEN
jgi:hypothetical protein